MEFMGKPFKNKGFSGLSLEQAELVFEAVQERIRNRNSYAYALVMQEEDETYTVHQVANQPCWGDLRDYIGKEEKRRPNDLIYPFPGGKPIALAAVFRGRSQRLSRRYLTGSDSPFRNILKTDKDGIVVFPDLNVDSNYLVNCLFAFNHRYDLSSGTGLPAALVGSLTLTAGDEKRRLINKDGRCKWIRAKFDLDALAKAEPGNAVGLFSDRAPYDRFNGGVEGIWNGEDSLHDFVEKKPAANGVIDLDPPEIHELIKVVGKELEKRRA